jgi:hypothetical protein
VKDRTKTALLLRYCYVEQLDGNGRTAAQVATMYSKHDVAALLQGLGI